MTWLWFLLGGARKLAQGLFRLVRSHPLQCALIVSLGLSAALWTRGNRYRDKLLDCTAGRKADRDAYTAAQIEAERLAAEARSRQEARYERLAKEADDDHAEQLADARAAAERFIVARRVRAEAAGGPSGATSAGAESGGSESGDGPGANAELVAVSADDVRVCTENTARLVSVREWALSLADQ